MATASELWGLTADLYKAEAEAWADCADKLEAALGKITEAKLAVRDGLAERDIE